ncbi:50S ribosomal protein L3 N(5)-glutamine methyltransferase [Methylotenera sp.]|uniref:50S ribosomal protein L3 N(5)-glutamine methyltransferase n=1 Tax=Methylotenera sp. TaxID=2051956 RepID=UPI00271C5C3B|nr:50S ribosomal protein L3 N(5)-glutamine methyltransferase [Methylotenera sp.]MDO9204716.1 50S ribosomal protein L3 N(5)-glutamine methyltransferase [Methylotenera sp.]MDP1522295.1 50S ribosomal protein L3 N(5)-glutamine methyltransferase [Methylotenera sp.]MDP2071083.1 50S ribosomal protein L3 N(5)-glutamine methyltransferase [Methylotenera sp.]MDP3005957.1 50S ribosomal protein L3 N(5)-glutamine methyltransferase [Methylotenera sp.]MDP3308162.1 50S ribosomal protein L3 N(5)-glutamine methy
MTNNNAQNHIVHSELFTVRDWIRFAVSQFEASDIFYGHGTDNAYDEAVWLIMSGLHLPMDTLNNFLDARLIPTERNKLAAFIEQRISKHTPTAYLLKEAWLQGLKFYVDERVLIPRSFIAELLANGLSTGDLSPWIEFPEMIESAADICTGSGCLGVLLASVFPNAAIDVIDISQDAIDVANINIANYGLQEQVTAIKSDMFSALKGPDNKPKLYDLIISNPPYVDAPSMAALPQEYQNEPQLALGSGIAGLDHTHTILREAANYLNDDGILIVEIGHNREALEAAYPNIIFNWLEVSSGNEFVFLLTKSQLTLGHTPL